MTTRFFVIIEGDGIAAQVLCRELFLKGIPTQLSERGPFPRDKVCGGMLQPENWEYLKTTFHLDEKPVPIRSISHYWRGKRLSRIRLNEPILSLQRLRLDSALHNYNVRHPEARSAEGSKISDSSAACGGLRMTNAQNTLRINARGISGNPACRAGDWIGFQAETGDVEGLEMHYGRGMYLGRNTNGGGVSHTGFIVKRALFRNPEELKIRVERELGLKLQGALKGTGPIRYGRSSDPTAVGDAKLTTHPFMGLGIKHAIESSRLLARRIEEGNPDQYEEEHRKRFSRMRLASLVADRLFDSPAKSVLWPVFKLEWLFMPVYRWVHG